MAAGLLSLSIPLLLNLLPTSFLSLRKAELIQNATNFALYRLDEASFLRQPRVGVDVDERIAVGDLEYRVVREFYLMDEVRWDVVVSCSCSSLAPVKFSTRLVRAPQ